MEERIFSYVLLYLLIHPNVPCGAIERDLGAWGAIETYERSAVGRALARMKAQGLAKDEAYGCEPGHYTLTNKGTQRATKHRDILLDHLIVR